MTPLISDPAKELLVCERCENPLLWTFAFPGCEWYCPSCGAASGMLGFGKKVKLTPARKKKLRSLKIRWGQIVRHLQTGGGWKEGCAKCDKRDEYHCCHLTEEEKRKKEWAWDRLRAMILPAYRLDGAKKNG